jgi:hypothetical protein
VQPPFWERGLQLVSWGFRGRERHACGGVCCPYGREAAHRDREVNAASRWVRGLIVRSRRGYSLADSPVRFRAFLAHSFIRSSFPWPFAVRSYSRRVPLCGV